MMLMVRNCTIFQFALVKHSKFISMHTKFLPVFTVDVAVIIGAEYGPLQSLSGVLISRTALPRCERIVHYMNWDFLISLI